MKINRGSDGDDPLAEPPKSRIFGGGSFLSKAKPKKRKGAPALDYKLMTTKAPSEPTTEMMARLLAVRAPVRALCKSVHMAALVDCLVMQKATAVSMWRPGNKGQDDATFRLLIVDEKTYAEVLEYLRAARATREATPADFGAGDA